MKEHKNHNISSIKDAIGVIEKENVRFKHEAKQVIEEVEGLLMVCKANKSKLEQAYLFLEQMIKKQFRELEMLLKAKEKEVSEFLERTF